MGAHAGAGGPGDLLYTAEHEWVRVVAGGRVRVGVTAYAAEQLGDVVFVDLPQPGAPATAGEPMGEIESTKSVSEVFAPVTGTVTAVNDALDGAPEQVNAEPYGGGWLVEISTGDEQALDAALAGMMDEAQYRAGTAG